MLNEAKQRPGKKKYKGEWRGKKATIQQRKTSTKGRAEKNKSEETKPDKRIRGIKDT